MWYQELVGAFKSCINIMLQYFSKQIKPVYMNGHRGL